MTETLEEKENYWEHEYQKLNEKKQKNMYTPAKTDSEKRVKRKVEAVIEKNRQKVRKILDVIENLIELEQEY